MKKTVKISAFVLFLISAFVLLFANVDGRYTLPAIILMLVLLFIISFKWTARFLLTIFALILLVWLLIQTSPVQNFLLGKLTQRLSKDLNTEVNIRHVDFSLFDKMDLDGTLIKDLNKDTLLYAGTLKLRITDWFFLKDKIDLKYIGLEDGRISMNRTDSVWNYQFLIDHFSKPKTDTSKGRKIDFNIEKIDLKKVSFINNDEWVGQKMTLRIGALFLDAQRSELDKNRFVADSVTLDRPSFTLEDFEGKRPENLRPPKVDTGMYFNEGGLYVAINRIRITNGIFTSLKKGEVPDPGYFDGAFIRVSEINGTLKQFNFIEDTISARVDLSAIERSGFKLNKLQADFKLTPEIMEFKNLDIKTPKSRIGNYYAMHFDDFNEDMSDYIDSVEMTARFRNSFVSTDDIAFFAPELSDWKKDASISGNFFGTVSAFDVDNIFLRTGPNTYAAGDFSMRGLPDIDATQIKLSNANVQTNRDEIAFLYPGIKEVQNPDLKALGNLRFIGNFSGTIHDFNLNGNLSSRLGGMNAKLNLVLPLKGEPSYNGVLKTTQFALGKFIHSDSLGAVSFDGKIIGTSFNLDKARARLDGTFHTLGFNGYTYRNLVFDATIEKKKFSGDFKASDPNFDFTSSAQIDFTGSKPSFNVLGDLAIANFKKLNLTNKDFRLTGLFDLNFVGRNIDEFLGTAKILNATLWHDSTQLDFDSLALRASYDSINKKRLTAESNQFQVVIRGQYNILDLPNSFQTFLSGYYPAYINRPKVPAKNQEFKVEINTRDFDKYAQVIDQKLSGLDDMHLEGGVNTNSKDSGFYVFANIPNASYDKFRLENGVIKGFGTFDSLKLTGDMGRIYIGDSLFFPNSELTVTSANNVSNLHLSTRANETLNEADLNAVIVALDDGVRIDFLPSSFVLNSNKWTLEKQGELVIRKHFTSAKNVVFKQGFQEITVESLNEEGGNTSNLIVQLRKINLGDFMPLFTRRPRMEGEANGQILLKDFYNNFNAEAEVTASGFRLNNDSVGVVSVNANYSSLNGKILFSLRSQNENYNLTSDGLYDLRDSVNRPLLVNLHLNKSKIGIVNEFLGTIFSDIDGLATGDLSIQGDPDSPHLLGEVFLQDAALTVNYTQVRYTIDSAYFVFKDDRIDFGRFTVHDRYNNSGTVRGILYQTGFDNMRYDFDLETPKLLLLDTKIKDNQQFYGKAIGTATMSLKGAQDNMRMNITAAVNDTTHIFIPTNESRENADADFIVFKKYGKEIEAPPLVSDTKLTIDLDLTATNQAEVDVILDALTGDIIKATGNGRIRMHIPATGDMTMTGRYNIESGSYNFNFQSFLRKPFDLIENAGNYIEWNGDPFKADLNIDARYTAKNVTFSELLSSTGYTFNGTVRGYRGDVYVIASLTGKLTNPQIKFNFGFPPGSLIENDNQLLLFLNKIQSDDNEMLKQVTWLIVFGSFAPYGELGSGGNTVRTAGLNTISQKITGELNKLVSNLLTKITGDKSLQFDVSTSTYSSSIYYSNNASASNQLDRQQVNLKVNQSILNGKVIFTFGTGLDFNISGSTAFESGNFQWLPDISVQIILSKDRKLRAIIFNKSSLDVTSGIIGRRTRQGVSISYSFDFPRDTKIPVYLDTIPKPHFPTSPAAQQRIP